MRVALMIGTLQVGGAELQLARLAGELRSAGHVVRVYAQGPPGPVGALLDDADVPWRALGCGVEWVEGKPIWQQPRVLARELRRTGRLLADLRAFRPEVLHAYLFDAYMMGMPLGAAARVPVRVSGRRGLVSARPHETRYRRSIRAVNRLTHAVVANSRAIVAEARALEQVPEDKLHVIPNGVDLPAEVSDVVRQPPTGLVVANLHPYKGHRDLVEALKLLPDPPRVRLVGDGHERAWIEEQARLHLPGVLRLEGRVPRASELYREVQFAVLPSHSEGLPNAVLEAMAWGVPVVATAVGGTPELVEHEVTGLLVPPHRPDLLAEAVGRVAGDPDLRARLGAAARDRAAGFSWKACLEAHTSLYAELLEARQR